MAYLPPPLPPPAPRRRPPRWSTTPVLAREVQRYAAGDLDSGRRIRRLLAPTLAALAEASAGRRTGRHRVAQTAVTVALADLETGRVPPDGVAVVGRAVAHVLEATAASMLEWLAGVPAWQRALVRLLDVDLADVEGFGRAFTLDVAAVARGRQQINAVLDLPEARDSACAGWPDVRAALRLGDDGGAAHRRVCGRCGLVARHTVVRRQRVWRPDAPEQPGRLAAPFELRRR